MNEYYDASSPASRPYEEDCFTTDKQQKIQKKSHHPPNIMRSLGGLLGGSCPSFPPPPKAPLSIFIPYLFKKLAIRFKPSRGGLLLSADY